jgi:hypothetical protein
MSVVTDILGTADGTTVTASIGNCISIINTLYDVDSSNIANLITEYNNILANTIASDNGNVLLSISKAANVIGNIANANPTETASLNTNFLAVSTQITTETGLQVKAGIDIGNVEGNSQTSIMSFVSSLPGYGLDTKVGGSAQYLENVSTPASAGQSNVAVLREGRTTAALSVAGVGTAATTVNPTPSTVPPQAVLSSSRIFERQAQSQVIY